MSRNIIILLAAIIIGYVILSYFLPCAIDSGSGACKSYEMRKEPRLETGFNYRSPFGFTIKLPKGWLIIDRDNAKLLVKSYLNEEQKKQYDKYPRLRKGIIKKYHKSDFELYHPGNMIRNNFTPSIKARIFNSKERTSPIWTISMLQNGIKTFCQAAYASYRNNNQKPMKAESCTVIQVNKKYGFLYRVSFPDIRKKQVTIVLQKSSNEIIYFTLYLDPATENKYYPIFLKIIRTVSFSP